MRETSSTGEQAYLKNHATSLRSLLMFLATGVVVSVAVAVLNIFFGLYQWTTILAYGIIGYTMVVSGWVAEQLWSSAFARLFRNPFTVPAYLSRVPFWLLAGGVGYTLAVLVSKKILLLGVYDIPVWDIFYFGVKFGFSIYLALVIILRKSST